MIDAVRAYLEMLRTPPTTAGEALRTLARVLDQLSGAYHDTIAVDVEDSPDPPPQATYDEMRALAARAFPALGFYAVTRPRDVPSSEGLLADAIDDLADIALEMLEVEWRWLHYGAADATWQFRWGYGGHWGRHLHDLRGYVHALQFEGTECSEPIVDERRM